MKCPMCSSRLQKVVDEFARAGELFCTTCQIYYWRSQLIWRSRQLFELRGWIKEIIGFVLFFGFFYFLFCL